MNYSNNKITKVSVVIPCYNYGKYLVDAVESVLGQTYDDYEIIIVDDGSNDTETIEVLDKINEVHPEILMVRQENQGVSAARNNGIKSSKGEYILILDADDKIEPEMLMKCVEEIEKDAEIGFIYTNVKYFGEYDFVLRKQEYSFYDLLLANYIVVASLFRKKAWEDVGGYDEKMKNGFEDWEFFIRMGKNGWFGRLIKEPLFCYRKHGKSVNYEAAKKHEEIISYIREKHADIYSEENLNMLKKKWNSESFFAGIWKTITREIFSIRLKLIFAGVLNREEWIEHPLRTLGHCIPVRMKKGINKIFGKEILKTDYFRKDL